MLSRNVLQNEIYQFRVDYLLSIDNLVNKHIYLVHEQLLRPHANH